MKRPMGIRSEKEKVFGQGFCGIMGESASFTCATGWDGLAGDGEYEGFHIRVLDGLDVVVEYAPGLLGENWCGRVDLMYL